MKTIISVTKSHIKRGIRGDAKACPVALALHSHINKKYIVELSSTYAYFTAEGKDLGRWRMSKVVRKFVNDFDNSKKVCPLKFELNIDGMFIKQKKVKK